MPNVDLEKIYDSNTFQLRRSGNVKRAIATGINGLKSVQLNISTQSKRKSKEEEKSFI